MDADGKIEASAFHKVTISNGESELVPLQQAPWDAKMSTESDNDKLLDLFIYL